MKIEMIAVVLIGIVAGCRGIESIDSAEADWSFPLLRIFQESGAVAHGAVDFNPGVTSMLFKSTGVIKGDASSISIRVSGKAQTLLSDIVRDRASAYAYETVVFLNVMKGPRHECKEHQGAPTAYLILDDRGYGVWFLLHRVEGTWECCEDAGMLGVWEGGVDMLFRQLRSFRDVPSGFFRPRRSSGSWGEAKRWRGRPLGTPSAFAGITWGPYHARAIFVASRHGDRLFIRGGQTSLEMEDITEHVGIATRSDSFCWTDVNEDGRLDLIGLEHGDLYVSIQDNQGRFAQEVIRRQVVQSNEMASVFHVPRTVGASSQVLLVGTDVMAYRLERGRIVDEVTLLAEGRDGMMAPRSHCKTGVLADFTNDGLLDLLVSDGARRWAFAGSAIGGFDRVADRGCVFGADACDDAASGSGRWGVVADIDADGLLDVLTTNGESLNWFRNLGALCFTNRIRSTGALHPGSGPRFPPCIVDVNGDGIDDAVVERTPDIDLRLGVGFGAFRSGWIIGDGSTAEANGPFWPLAFDMDGDGDYDVIAINEVGDMVWWENTSAFPERSRVIVTMATEAYKFGSVRVDPQVGGRSLGAKWFACGGHAILSLPKGQSFRLRWQFPGCDVKENVFGPSNTFVVLPAK